MSSIVFTSLYYIFPCVRQIWALDSGRRGFLLFGFLMPNLVLGIQQETVLVEGLKRWMSQRIILSSALTARL